MNFWRTLPGELEAITDRSKSNLVWFSYFAGGFSILYSAVSIFYEQHIPGGIQMFVCGILFFIIPWLIKRGISIRLLTHFYVVLGCICVYYNTYIRGGIFDPVIFWSIFIPLVPLLILGVKDALVWVAITVIIVITFFFLELSDHRDQLISKESLDPFFNLTVLLGIILLVFMISQTFNFSKNEALIALNDKNKELDQAQQELLVAQKYKDLFLANVSHELRTPMNIIIGLSEMLKRKEQDEENKRLLEGMNDSARKLLVLINDILEISKVKSGTLSIQKAVFNPVELLTAVHALFEQKRSQKGLQGKILLPENMPAALYADPMRINQVITNLMDNAIKYSDAGCISLSASMDGEERLVVSIKDEGRGIAGEKLPYLFDPFYRVDPNEKMEGLGLGLAIVKQVIDALGGSINIESAVGLGTTVTFTVPVTLAADAAPAVEAITGEVRESLRGIRVLVAEDILLNRVITEDILTRNIPGCSVAFAGNGHEVLEKMAASTFDFILMDIRMPEMDGLQAAREIRQQYGDQPMIIALTANAMSDERTACLDAGMNDHVAKPIMPEELILKMFRLLPTA